MEVSSLMVERVRQDGHGRCHAAEEHATTLNKDDQCLQFEIECSIKLYIPCSPHWHVCDLHLRIFWTYYYWCFRLLLKHVEEHIKKIQATAYASPGICQRGGASDCCCGGIARSSESTVLYSSSTSICFSSYLTPLVFAYTIIDDSILLSCSPEAWPEISIEVSSWAMRQAEEAAISAAIATGSLELAYVDIDIGPTEGLAILPGITQMGRIHKLNLQYLCFVITSLLASLISTQETSHMKMSDGQRPAYQVIKLRIIFSCGPSRYLKVLQVIVQRPCLAWQRCLTHVVVFTLAARACQRIMLSFTAKDLTLAKGFQCLGVIWSSRKRSDCYQVMLVCWYTVSRIYMRVHLLLTVSQNTLLSQSWRVYFHAGLAILDRGSMAMVLFDMSHGCLEHIWTHVKTSIDRSKIVFFFQMCCDRSKVGKQIQSQSNLQSRLCLQPIQSVWATCHVTAMALGWQAIIEDGFWKMQSSSQCAPVASRLGFCRWRRNGRN